MTACPVSRPFVSRPSLLTDPYGRLSGNHHYSYKPSVVAPILAAQMKAAVSLLLLALARPRVAGLNWAETALHGHKRAEVLMKSALNFLSGICMLGGWFFIVHATGFFTMPVRVAIVVGAVGLLVVAHAIYAFQQRTRQQALNEMHCAVRGLEFVPQPDIPEERKNASLFQKDNVSVDQLARGNYGGTAVEVFDLHYRETVHSNEGGSSTYTVSQTVVSVPFSPAPGRSVRISPIGGFAGKAARFLGFVSKVVPSGERDSPDPSSADWFNKRYGVAVTDDESTRLVERMLSQRLVNWLRERGAVTAELAGDSLLLWRTNQVLHAEARDSLVAEAIDLSALLDKHKLQAGPSLVTIERATVTSPLGLMLRMMISAFASFLLAAVVLMGGFLVAIATGAIERAPMALMITLLVVSMALWFSSSVLIYWLLARYWRFAP
jgi:hypothetical protein